MIELPLIRDTRKSLRRANLWEFQFRSFYFGEFGYNHNYWNLARVILALAMVALIAAVSGLCHSIVKTPLRDLPILLTLFFALSAAIVSRYLYPLSCTQDFRYLAPMLIPGTVYWLRGIIFGQTIARTIWLVAGAIQSISCAVFLVFALWL